MVDDKTKPDMHGRDCIDCNEEFELVYWSTHHGVSKEELLAIIARVGPRVSDVTAAIVIRGPDLNAHK
jgi:hypothetical protein